MTSPFAAPLASKVARGEQDFTPLARLTTTEVCQIARISRATLWRRVACGRLPKPIDQARQALFCAEGIERALRDPKPPEPTAVDVVISQRLARMHAKYRSSTLISDY